MPDQSSAASEHAILQEITGPLETLPDDPLAVVSADFPGALRGYDRLAVDDYVRRISRMVAELQATRSPEAAVRRALERVGEQISGILQRAHDTAEQITAQSRSEAEDRLEHARREAGHLVEAAEQRVRDLDTDTDRIWTERQRIVADAEDLSAQLLALARNAGERFPGEPDPSMDAGDAGLGADAGSEAGAGDAGLGTDVADAGLGADPGSRRADPDGSEVDPGIERTVAFTPLTSGEETAVFDEDETAVLDDDEPPAASGPQAEPDAAGGPPEGSPRARDDRPSSVIPPASQAASRRRSR